MPDKLQSPVLGPDIDPGCGGVDRTVNDLEYVPQILNTFIVTTQVVHDGPKLIVAVLDNVPTELLATIASPVTDHT